MRYCLIIAALVVLGLACTKQPDPYCPGGDVIVTDCLPCRGVLGLFEIPAASTADYKAATQRATQPATMP